MSLVWEEGYSDVIPMISHCGDFRQGCVTVHLWLPSGEKRVSRLGWKVSDGPASGSARWSTTDRSGRLDSRAGNHRARRRRLGGAGAGTEEEDPVCDAPAAAGVGLRGAYPGPAPAT